MKIYGIGTDIVDIRRLRKDRELDRVIDFLFTEKEKNDAAKSRDKAEFVASRLAVKESVIKAHPGVLTYTDIEITKKGQKPTAFLLRRKDRKFKVLVSLAHERDYAIGYAILYA